jgi:hypothetical protein
MTDKARGGGDVFNDLRKAWLRGTPIVPLLGAGVSIGSSIPITSHLIDYLVKVKCLKNQEPWWPSCSDLLRVRGWPSRHQLNVDLVSRFRSAKKLANEISKARQQLFSDAIRSELGPRQPTVFNLLLPGSTRARRDSPSWSALLQVVTGRQQDLIDAFFDRLVRDRHPCTAHRFIAFLTRLMSWKLILTTNFDDLTETAMRNEGLAPVVYELFAEGSLPDQRLVKSHLAVLKMNGGAFGLRAGFELDEPLDPRILALFHGYLPKDAILLVLGYGGTERRVTTILESLAEQFTPGEKRIIWINPGELPRFQTRALNEAISYLRHSDAGLFLQELYEYSSFSHAVGTAPYDAVHQLPEADGPSRRISPSTQPDKSSFAPSKKQLHENAEREKLLKEYEEASTEPDGRQYQKLWFNLYEISSPATFFDLLLEELRRCDRSLPPLILSPVLDFKVFDGSEDGRRGRRFWYQFIAVALRRYKYLIAIDAIRAFSNAHPAAWLRSSDFSRDGVRRDTENPLEEALHDLQKGRRKIFLKVLKEFCEFFRDEDLGGSRFLVLLDPKDRFSSRSAQIKIIRNTSAPAENARKHAEGACTWLAACGDIYTELARVAASFRRPRSHVALVRLAAKSFMKRLSIKGDSKLRGDAPDLSPITAEWEKIYRQVEIALSILVKHHFLSRQDGGSYCMNNDLRNELYELYFEKDHQNGARSTGYTMSALQLEIAHYYRIDLYQQSQDLAAYLEYVYHRGAGIDWTNAYLDKTVPRDVQRLEEEVLEQGLIASLDREGGLLTGRGYASAVIAAVEELREIHKTARKFDSNKKRHDRIDAEMEKLDRIEAGAWRDVTDYGESSKTHLKNAQRILDEIRPEDVEAGRSPAPLLLTEAGETRPLELGEIGPVDLKLRKHAELAERVIDVGRCVNRSRASPKADLKKERKLIGDIGTRAEIMQLDPAENESIQASLVELALDIIAKCQKVLRRFDQDSSVAIELQKRLQPLEVRCRSARLDYWTRMAEPWNPDAPHHWKESSAGRQKKMENHFQKAIGILRLHGRGERGLEAQCRLRCARARNLYLLGNFARANQELNRAHAFAAQLLKRDAPVTQAAYWLHRAEYCLLHADKFGQVANNHPKNRLRQSRLFELSEAGLAQAEELLLKGRRDVFWWCRLFLLKARLGCERLKASFHSVHALQEGRQFEAVLLAALTAVAGGLANVHQDEVRRTKYHVLWTDLEEQYKRLQKKELQKTKPADVRDKWRRYVERAGLEFFDKEHKKWSPPGEA